MQRTVSRMSRKPRVCPPLSVNGERLSDGGLHAEAIEHRAEDVVVIEAIDERLVQSDFVGHGAVDHALIQIGGAQSPDLAGNMMLWLSWTLER